MIKIIQRLSRDQGGQSLLEMLVALLILVTALTATIVLIVTSINASRDSRNKLIASNLAREGIEMVRNIRDSNWVDPSTTTPPWDDGLTSGDDPTAVPNIKGGTDTITLDFTPTTFAETPYTAVKLSGTSYLQGLTASGTSAGFFRLLYLNPICRDQTTGTEQIIAKTTSSNCIAQFGANYEKVGIRVIVEVRFPNSSSSKKVLIEDRLYNWQVL